jgi:5-methylcytosine-specific restriction protein B
LASAAACIPSAFLSRRDDGRFTERRSDRGRKIVNVEKSLTPAFPEGSVGRWSRTAAPDNAYREQRTDGTDIDERNMVNFWKIAPGLKAEVWDETHKQECITINWMNKTDFKQFLKKFTAREERIKALTDAGVGNKISANSILYFVDDVQPGDTVVANKGRSRVEGIGVVKSAYLGPKNVENPRKNEKRHRHARLVNWLIDKPMDFDEFLFNPNQPPTVLKLESDQCDKIKQAYLKKYPELKETLDELFPDQNSPNPESSEEATMKKLLEQFRQIIAYGPPGTGKTREAKHVALALLSGKEPKEDANEDEIEKLLEPYRNDNRFALVVFHPAYEYEQFVGGIEPNVIEGKVAFDTKPGVFLRLCRKAKESDKPCVLIIDEINRGNLPKLLGEMVYALEYRGHEVSLPFTCGDSYKNKLVVPKNLYVLATMNSADRSIGHIDVAIRRRFALFPLLPSPAVVRKVWGKIGDENYGNKLADLMDKLNAMLKPGNDSNAEMEAGVGHSYFLPTLASGQDTEKLSVKEAKAQVGMKWTYQVQPLLREYEQLLNRGTELEKYFKSSLESLLAPS